MSKVAKRSRKPQTPPAASPVAVVTNPPDSGMRYVWCGPVAGVHVTEFTVLKIAAVIGCVRFIATQIAQVDYNVYERKADGGKVYRADDPVDWILDKEANPETPAMIFWETILIHALIWGNGYAEIERDAYQRPRWLWLITPDRVQLKRNAAGEQVYHVHNYQNETTILDARNVFHLRGLSWDGQTGYDIARLCRDVFGGAIAAQDFANAFFGNDATPGGLLTTDKTLSQNAMDRLKSAWMQKHRGPDHAHLLAVLEEGLKYQQVSATAEQAQLTQTQQAQVEQIARIFGVPLSKIGHMLHSGSRANMEEEDRSAYKQCLRPWARKIECEADVKLFGRVNQGKFFTLHDFSVLLRGSSEQMTNQACQLLDRGVLEINEARDLFDYNPISTANGGKTRPFPRNFTILEKAGDDPKPTGSAGGAASGDAPGAGRSNNPPGTARATAMPAQVQATFQQLLEDAYARLLRVEADKAKRAGNKEQLGTHIVGYYTEDSARHVAATLQPVVAALLLALGHAATQADALATRFAEDHAVRSVAQLCDGTWQDAWANGRAKHEAEAHLQQLWEAVR